MKLIPLTQGQVALVDDEDFEKMSFVSEMDAARAYDSAARKYFGDFACPNF